MNRDNLTTTVVSSEALQPLAVMPKKSPPLTGVLGSRPVTYLKGGLKTLTTGLNDVANDVEAIITASKLIFYSCSGMLLLGCGTDQTCVANLVGTMERSSDIIEWTRVGDDFPGLSPSKLSKDIKEKNHLMIPAKVLFAIADVGATFLLLAECGWDKLGECAQLMGKIPVFGTLGLSVLNVTQITAITGFTFVTLNTAMTLGVKMAQGENCTREWVGIASLVTGLAFKAFVIAGCGSAYPTLYIVWGIVSASSGLVSFFVTKYYDRLEEKSALTGLDCQGCQELKALPELPWSLETAAPQPLTASCPA